MAHVYEKMTKDTIDLPAYTLCFLGVILDKLEFYGLIEGKKSKLDTAPPDTIIMPITSRLYPYCYDGVNLIEKTVNRRGFTCKMDKYQVVELTDSEGKKREGYSYQYKITKNKK